MTNLLQQFYQQGYDYIDPPLVEYADSLTHGVGASITNNALLVMDGLSLRPLILRPDMTAGVARIAAEKLATLPRPLRLCYGGDIITQHLPSGLTPQRQLTQVGVELIGHAGAAADIEILWLLLTSLDGLLTRPLYLDLAMPPLTNQLLAELSTEVQQRAEALVRHKDGAALRLIDHPAAKLLAALMMIHGDAATVREQLQPHQQHPAIAAAIERLTIITDWLMPKWNQLHYPPQLSIDITELNGFDYKSGFAFTLFDRTSKLTLGRGGRYTIAESGEAAVGFSLYLDNFLSSVKNLHTRATTAVASDDLNRQQQLLRAGERIARILS